MNLRPLNTIHTEIFGKAKECALSHSKTSQALSDDELIDKITKSKIGNKFGDLWRGDVKYLKYQYGYASPSVGFWLFGPGKMPHRWTGFSGVPISGGANGMH
ncbi:MAG: hypothetical protein PHU44_08665 [Syntrophales bacterium]|nr:hypothetical protein [Syntrophales bacterium]MDD5643215.1 hypothetical protein [Syntrophales bacterium]